MDHTRPLGRYGGPEGRPRIVLLRGVYADGEVTNRRLKWNGSAYEQTNEQVEFFDKSSATAIALAEGEETFVFWRPAAKRYEQIGGSGSAVYLVTPVQPIAAGTVDGDGNLELGSGYCVILKRTGDVAEPQVDTGGGPLLLFCYNRCASGFDAGADGFLLDGSGLPLVDDDGYLLTTGSAPDLIEGFPRLLAIRDRFGDYYLQPCGGRGNVIYAQVNDGSGVGSGDATFSFDNAVALVGYAPSDGTGTAQNQYAQTYSNDDWVILFQRTDNDEWLTEQDGDAGTIIYAQVNDGSGVGGGDATFAFDNAIAIVGTAPAGGTGTGQNQYGQTYANDEWVLLFQEKATATWLTERKAATLTSAKALINNAAGYSSADSSVNWDGGSAITGTLSSSSGSASNVHSKAFRDNEEILLFQNEITGTFYAVKIEADIQVATVNEGSGVATTDTTFSFDAGSALEGVGQTTGTAKNPCGLAFSDDEKFIAVLADDGEWIPIKQQFDGTVIFRCKPGTDILGTTPFSAAASTFEAVKGLLPTDDPISVANPLKLYIASGKWATCIKKNDGTFEAIYAEDHVTTFLKAQSNYSPGATRQYFAHESGTFIWKTPSTCS